MIMEYTSIPIYYNDKRYNVYQNELMNFFIFLTKVHPAFILDKSLKAQCRQFVLSACDELCDMNNITLADFQLRINELLVFLQDAHTFVNIEPLSLYPFSVRYFNGSFYLYSISSRYKNVTGKVITSMGGMDIIDIHKKLAGMLPAENKIKAGITGSHFLNNPSLIKRLGIDGDVLEIVFSDGDRINIDKENGTNNQPDQMTVIKPNSVTARQPVPYHYRIIDSICYFQFNEMFDSYTYQLGCQLSGETPDENIIHSLPFFTEFLEHMIQDMNQKGVSLLVVDMRYNGGGNSLLGNMLLEALNIHLSDIESYRTYIRPSSFLKEFYPFLLDKSAEMNDKTLAEQNQDRRMGKEVPLSKHKYTGKVVFIQGQNTFSSANYLLTTVKDNHLFPIIGMPTSQKPTCYGDIIPISLPFTGTKGYVSHSFFRRPDSLLDEETTLMPDTLINTSVADYLKGVDNCWDWIKRLNYLL
ncbi:S41 family peptidase [Phocaeicola sartorii]|uniref:S41 family peptidase n=1 Tax=Phocaeicola sartorii TaxID=671267 RepID=UPI00248B469F|nr:S41 family peptidase [Phocaeicola sartorii]